MKFGSLFSGIGGMDLGLERAGMECRWQVEIDEYASKVLAKHWPAVRRFRDVREVGKQNLEPVDLICGGFPCQDISNAGKRVGIDGERSGLWSEMVRVIRDLRPRFVLVENVAALLDRGMGRVLGDLAACGYDADWDVLPAFAFGAEHRRDRLFIIAYSNESRLQIRSNANPNSKNASVFGERLGFTIGTEMAGLERRGAARWRGNIHGIPRRVDRIKCLGNAVVPQVAEWIGRRIIETLK